MPELSRKLIATEDKIEQIKICSALLSSAYHNNVLWKNPLPSIVGETASFMVEDYEVYLEQINMRPSTALLYVKGPGITISGFLRDSIEMNSAGVLARNTGDLVFDIENTGVRFVANAPPVQISGLMGTKRKFTVDGESIVYCEKENLLVRLHFCPQKPSLLGFMSKTPDQDLVEGEIYTLPPDTMAEIIESKAPRQLPKLQHGKDGVVKIGIIDGHWTSSLNIDGL